MPVVKGRIGAQQEELDSELPKTVFALIFYHTCIAKLVIRFFNDLCYDLILFQLGFFYGNTAIFILDFKFKITKLTPL